jgi:predicted ester cyclase
MGVAPTGNPVAWSELHAYRVHDGMIVEIWTEADFLGIMVQIGAVTMPG